MRPEAQAKLGYYPTPPPVVDLIAQHLNLTCPNPQEPVQHHDQYAAPVLLDPCAGTGAAAKQLLDAIVQRLSDDCSKPHRGFAYGVELHEQRATEAQKALRRCARAPIQAVDLPDSAFNVALVNPPYDDEYSDEHRRSRLESTFLAKTTPALDQHGVLIYIVPQRQLAVDAAHIAANYYNVRIFRFPDQHFDQFRQAVVIARRNQRIGRSLNIDQHVFDQLAQQAGLGVNARPLVDNPPADDRVNLPVPFWRYAGNLPNITVNAESDRNITNYLKNSDAYRHPTIAQRTAPKPAEEHFFKPLEPLRRGHLCVLAANGQFDQTPLHDPTGQMHSIVIKGQSRKIVQQVHNDDETITDQDVFTTDLNVLNLSDGSIEHIDDDQEALQQFLIDNQARLETALAQRHQPSVNPSDDAHAPVRQRIASLARRPIGKQRPSSVTAAVAISQLDELFMVGQPGIGKTFLTIAACRGANYSRMVVITPSHNPETWIREITATWPEARVRIGNPNHPQRTTYNRQVAHTDLETIFHTPADPEHPVWAILKRDTAKRTYPFKIITRKISSNPPEDEPVRRLYRDDHGGIAALPADDPETHHTCPFCWTPLDEALKSLQHRTATCPACHRRLATPNCVTKHDRRIPWTDYIAHHHPAWADVFIMDEVHQYKNRDSAQGEVARRLAQASKRVIALTGTLIGGKATDAFYLLNAVSRRFRRQYGYQDYQQFLELYGRQQRVSRIPAANSTSPSVGAHTTRRLSRVSTREINGFKPSLMNHFWENTIFTRIPDIAPEVPEPEIHAHLVELDGQTVTNLAGQPASQLDAYHQLAHRLREYRDQQEDNLSFTLQARMQQELLTYPENCWLHTAPPAIDPESSICEIPALPAERIYPKEAALINLVADSRDQGANCLIYCTHTQKRDVTARLLQLLNANGIRAARLPNVPAERRLAWLEQAALKNDAIICHPQSVETGLNLLQFPTIIWYEIDYSLFLIEQASARSHRINQTQPVNIHFMAYAGTLQEHALRIIAAKADTGRLIYGELSSTGLSAFNPEADDVRSSIARELFNSEFSSGRPTGNLSEIFAHARADNSAHHQLAQRPLAAWEQSLPEFDDLIHDHNANPTPSRKHKPPPDAAIHHQPTLF